MNVSTKIMVVDDEPFNRDIMEEYLESEFEKVVYMEDGPKCLHRLKSFEADIVLLDVSMPNMDGYEVCTQIKQDFGGVSVIFVSARGSAQERLKGYQVGCEDYIVKPFSEEELLQKIKRVIDYRNETTDLNGQLQFAKRTAVNAIINASEMGWVVGYLRNLFHAKNPLEVNHATLQFIQELDLNAVVRIVCKQNFYFNSVGGTVTPMEQDLIELLAKEDRIFSFNNRMQVNFNNINILIKNMPTENEDKMARLRDLIPIGLEAADNCLLTLASKCKAEASEKLADSMHVIDHTTQEINNNIRQLTACCGDALKALKDTINANVPSMGLDESQEVLIVDSADAVSVIMEDALDLLAEITEQMGEIKKQSDASKHQREH